MLQEFLAGTTLTVWPVIAFVLFFVTFVVVCSAIAAGIFERQNLSRIASLPLEDDETVEGMGS